MAENKAPFFADVLITSRLLATGEIVLGSAHPLGFHDEQIGAVFRRWTQTRGERPALIEMDARGALICCTGADLRDGVDRIAAALLARGLGPKRPVALLSEKSIAHAMLSLAAMQVGIPIAPISPAYSARSEAFDSLRFCLDLIDPAMIFVEDESALGFDLAALAPASVILTSSPAPGSRALELETLRVEPPDIDRLETAFASVEPTCIAKILFTSGSTGQPKAIINTHGNLVANMRAMLDVLPGLVANPPVVVDWQPWHHCGGGNHNFHAVMGGGGLYVLDRGKPTDQSFSDTIFLIKEMPPTIHFGTPLGYERLCDAMEEDADLQRAFFLDLRAIYYSGAAMPTSLWNRLETLARSVRGVSIPLLSGYGMTEFAPLLTMSHWPNTGPDMIGVPVPGCEVKLVPCDDGWDLRGRGPNLTPGTVGPNGVTPCDLDADGFLSTGDIVDFVDDKHPDLGLTIKGRSEERFKLMTGTWVPASKLRTQLIDACAPWVRDAVITGEKRDGIGALILLNTETVARDFGAKGKVLADLCRLPALLEALALRIDQHNSAHPASSRRIQAAMCVSDVPDLSRGETTDKGHINRRKYLSTRREMVENLYARNNAGNIPLSSEDKESA